MRIPLFMLLAAWAVALSGATPRSVRDGVYTDGQARRGEAVYVQECASCHGPTLGGVEMAPALTGAPFLANWNGLTAADLVDRIRLSMPPDNPGRLSRAQQVDVVAYILKVGKYPAGASELPAGAEPLKQILIDTPEP